MGCPLPPGRRPATVRRGGEIPGFGPPSAPVAHVGNCACRVHHRGERRDPGRDRAHRAPAAHIHERHLVVEDQRHNREAAARQCHRARNLPADVAGHHIGTAVRNGEQPHLVVLTAADVHAPALRCELNTLQARTAAERHAIENAVVPPVHAEDLAGIQHPQLARTCAKGQPVHTALEYCLGTGGRDCLPGGHHPRIGDRANRSLRRLCGSEGGHIEVKNDILAQRKELAQGLLQNCQTWARVLLSTFDTAVERWKRDGPMAAEREIMAQQDDFMKLDYWSLESTSPVLLFLKEDERFKPFVDSCVAFYNSALSVKRLVYGQIEDKPGHYVSAHEREVGAMVKLWHAEVERMLRDVSINHMKVMVLQPK